MASYYKYLMSFAKEYQQVKEAFHIPIQRILFVGHCLKTVDWIFCKHHHQRTFPLPHWKGNYHTLSTTDAAAKLEGIECMVHILQLKKALPDIWSCPDTEDPQIKLMRNTSS